MATPIYNDNATQFGSRPEAVFRADTTGAYQLLAVFEFESIDVKEPSTIIEKHDHIGRPKGWASVPGFRTATGTVQVPSTADATQDTGALGGTLLQNGDAFVEDWADGTGTTRPLELWIIVDTSTPYMQKEYRKQQVTLRHSPNPPAAALAIVASANTAPVILAA